MSSLLKGFSPCRDHIKPFYYQSLYLSSLGQECMEEGLHPNVTMLIFYIVYCFMLVVSIMVQIAIWKCGRRDVLVGYSGMVGSFPRSYLPRYAAYQISARLYSEPSPHLHSTQTPFILACRAFAFFIYSIIRRHGRHISMATEITSIAHSWGSRRT